MALGLPPLVYTFIYDIYLKILSPHLYLKKVTMFSPKYQSDHEPPQLKLVHQLPAACRMKAKFLTFKALHNLVFSAPLHSISSPPLLTFSHSGIPETPVIPKAHHVFSHSLCSAQAVHLA